MKKLPPSPCIKVNSLSKTYRLGSIGLGSLIDDLRGIGKRIGLPCKRQDKSKKFRALDQISFEAYPGEALGIIGHNGAGKSTLLKILSRITEPTSGEVILHGKVASLLEVGTGFHPDMTGRENIFLNGAFLGLSRREIWESFDSIVQFAHVEKFIDTPVKRYSSGMFVRLAFAVAAHLSPDILIVDEVLAVGDLGFQKKCIQKMQQVGESGMTILFVSHNLQMVKKLCKRSILLEKGKVVKIGKTTEVISSYLRSKEQLSFFFSATYKSDRRRGSGLARFDKVKYTDEFGLTKSQFEFKQKVCFKMEVLALDELANLRILIIVKNESQQDNLIAVEQNVSSAKIAKGKRVSFEILLDEHNLMAGSYPLYFWAGTIDHFHFDVLDDLLPPLQLIESTPNLDSPASICQSKSRLKDVYFS